MNEQKYEIAVDPEFLAKCLGLKEWPKPVGILVQEKDGPLYLCNWLQRSAARVITDAFRTKPGEVLRASIAMHNATSWVEMAYEKGIEEGMRRKEEVWQQKIRLMFGIK